MIELKIGYWIEEYNRFNKRIMLKCSICGEIDPKNEGCPNKCNKCGAIMTECRKA